MISRTLLVLIALSTPAYAEVVRIEVKSRADVLAGKPFGSAGPYKNFRARSTSPSIHGTAPTRSSPTSTGRRQTPQGRSSSLPIST